MNALLTDRLCLYPLHQAHLQAWLRGQGEVETRLGLPLALGTASAASLRAMAVKVQKMQKVAPACWHWYTYWLIQRQTPPLGIGLIGFKGAPNGRCEVEIGYGLAPAHRRRGYATEAVRAMLAWALADPACGSVCAITRKENIASQRVLQKTGFVLDETQDETLVWRIWQE